VITINLKDKLIKILKSSKENDYTAGRPLGDTAECSPGYHRHSDKYNGKCHRIQLRHRKHGDKPHKTNPAKQKTPVKNLQVKGK
jgi:hypothetical protein